MRKAYGPLNPSVNGEIGAEPPFTAAAGRFGFPSGGL
ncbi:MAG: hypothetical protein RLZZ265_592 [Verrucomicrobiota bacterium]|jgi:hypothetical protein